MSAQGPEATMEKLIAENHKVSTALIKRFHGVQTVERHFMATFYKLGGYGEQYRSLVDYLRSRLVRQHSDEMLEWVRDLLFIRNLPSDIYDLVDTELNARSAAKHTRAGYWIGGSAIALTVLQIILSGIGCA